MTGQPQESRHQRQEAALQRLLDIKGPVRSQQKAEQPFLQALDDVLALMDEVDAQEAGWLDGSLSGQSWQHFMEQLRIDLLRHLQRYRDNARRGDFSPATLSALKNEQQKIERLYVRDLVALYQRAAQTYKTLSG